MKKVLITGGCGFVGLNLIEVILNTKDWEINVLDDLSEGSLENLEKVSIDNSSRVNFFEGKIEKRNAIKAFDGCDYVVNLAAQSGVVPCSENPIESVEKNVLGVVNLLNIAKEKRIKRFVQASSNAALGTQEMPVNEKKCPSPESPYGASKLASEAYCRAFASTFDSDATVLRFSNVYGPWSYHKGSALHLFIRLMIGDKQITINGDGNQTRDFLNVKDVANAILLALEGNLESKFNLFQIATGKETSINEMVGVLRGSFKTKGIEVKKPKYGPEREGDVRRNYADISKAKRVLGYKPKVKFEEGVEETIDWFLSLKRK